MRKLTKTLLFLAAMSVYPVGALSAAPEKRASDAGKPGTEVRLLDETAGPLAAAPATRPAEAGGTKVSVSDAGTVDIRVSDASLTEVLRMLADQAHKNIVASKEVRGNVTANLYNVTIKEALDAILKANGYGYREKGNFIYVYSAKELAELEKAERQMVTEVFRLHYTPAAQAVVVLKPALSNEAQVSFTAASAVGIDGSAKETGGNSHASDDVIVVRDYPEQMERIRKVVKELDRRPQQILIEATILSATIKDNNALGIDFAITGGVDFSTLNGGFGDVLSGKAINNPTLTEKGVGAGATGFTAGVPNGGLRVGVVTNNIAVFVQALEAVTDTAVLANPKVLTLNKQRGEVLVGREDGYLTTTVTESTAVQSVDFLKTGTRLTFRPFIGDDGYIRMEIHPEDSDGQVVGGLPSKSTTEVTTNVLVKDGHTVVIGGLFRETNTTNRRQVPGIGNLPLVGALFRSQADEIKREEIIILLTPHIVKNDSAYSAVSEATLKDMERLRVGVRRGMMCFGRERLAEWCFDRAAAEMNKPAPDRKKALWHLDCATNLNPQFLEAVRMKEGITGREIASVDNSNIRSFVRKQILADRAPAPTPEPAPAAPAAKPAAQAAPMPKPVAITPATRPTTPPQASAPATRPAMPVAVLPTTRPVDNTAKNSALAPVELTSGVAAIVAAPATRPTLGEENARDIVVTELPVEEVDGE